ncbi:MAG: hypothetical protein ACMXYL_01855 [Candidatus Woesearchaeota archaeon]
MRRKVYGESKQSLCFFCSRQGLYNNVEGFPVCKEHKGNSVGSMRCICNRLLDVRKGRFGSFFVCDYCGPMSLSKVLEINRK